VGSLPENRWNEFVSCVAALSPASPDFLLTGTDFARIRLLIHQRAGISLSGRKRQMFYRRLSRRLRDMGMRGFSAYLAGPHRCSSQSGQGGAMSLTSLGFQPFQHQICLPRMLHGHR